MFHFRFIAGIMVCLRLNLCVGTVKVSVADTGFGMGSREVLVCFLYHGCLAHCDKFNVILYIYTSLEYLLEEQRCQKLEYFFLDAFKTIFVCTHI